MRYTYTYTYTYGVARDFGSPVSAGPHLVHAEENAEEARVRQTDRQTSQDGGGAKYSAEKVTVISLAVPVSPGCLSPSSVGLCVGVGVGVSVWVCQSHRPQSLWTGVPLHSTPLRRLS